jgi:hypothetical protein
MDQSWRGRLIFGRRLTLINADFLVLSAPICTFFRWNQVEMDMLEIDGYRAIIEYDSDCNIFRGEFVGLNGGADFYARNVDGLRKEGKISLSVFFDMCREDGVEPRKGRLAR